MPIDLITNRRNKFNSQLQKAGPAIPRPGGRPGLTPKPDPGSWQGWGEQGSAGDNPRQLRLAKPRSRPSPIQTTAPPWSLGASQARSGGRRGLPGGGLSEQGRTRDPNREEREAERPGGRTGVGRRGNPEQPIIQGRRRLPGGGLSPSGREKNKDARTRNNPTWRVPGPGEPCTPGMPPDVCQAHLENNRRIPIIPNNPNNPDNPDNPNEPSPIGGTEEPHHTEEPPWWTQPWFAEPRDRAQRRTTPHDTSELDPFGLGFGTAHQNFFGPGGAEDYSRIMGGLDDYDPRNYGAFQNILGSYGNPGAGPTQTPPWTQPPSWSFGSPEGRSRAPV